MSLLLPLNKCGFRPGRAQGLMPVILALWEAKAGRAPEVGSSNQDQPDQHGETPSLLKTQN